MPSSGYLPPRLLTNGHAQTIYAALLRGVKPVSYRRERIETPDGDFLDIDWSEVGGCSIAILLHGLEGSSRQPYMCGMTHALNRRGIDVVSVNLRGCSGEINRRLIGYDLGNTHDIELVSSFIAHRFPTRKQYLIGFSLGGNLVLKYLGELGSSARPEIEKAVAFSVPCDLASSAERIHASSNRLYFRQFMRSIQLKLHAKNQAHPGRIPAKALEWPRSFREFDECFTLPILGHDSPESYWERSSCLQHLSNIRVPSLLVNAIDDPLLGQGSYPLEIAYESKFLHLETPKHGGHVGFVQFSPDGEYWSETRAVSFIQGDK